MIIIDTETTGLLDEKPYITELYAYKMKEKQSLTILIKPPIPIPEKITKITGITDTMLKDAKPFSAYLPALQKFFLGEEILISHNIKFDVGMLELELGRCNALLNFPWPPVHICTAELSRMYSSTGHCLHMNELYKYLFKKDFKGAHRAEADVIALVKCVSAMIKRG